MISSKRLKLDYSSFKNIVKNCEISDSLQNYTITVFDIPIEVLGWIISFLDGETLFRLLLVNQSFYDQANQSCKSLYLQESNYGSNGGLCGKYFPKTNYIDLSGCFHLDDSIVIEISFSFIHTNPPKLYCCLKVNDDFVIPRTSAP